MASVLGHFHPLLVHLPIGGLVLLATLELIARFTRWKDAARSGPWILAFVCVGAIASAVCGWILAEEYVNGSALIQWHRSLALILVAACLLTTLMRKLERVPAYRASLCASVLLLIIVGDLGGSIAHGQDFFLTRHVVRWWRMTWGAGDAPAATSPSRTPPEQAIFSSVVKPILDARCMNCHGPEKHKAGLRLDSLEALARGGLDGAVVEPGQANESSLVHRMLLPLTADGHMPPEDQPQPTAEEIQVLKWWINSGLSLTNR